MSLIPYGAQTGFSLAAEIREMAAYYAVPARQVRSGRGGGPQVAHARAALFWKLVQHRRMTPGNVARMLKCSRQAVEKGVAAHAERIRQHQATWPGAAPSDDDIPGGLAIERSKADA